MEHRKQMERAETSQLDWRWMAAIGGGFVLCWASGFVVPRVFVDFAEPLTFVALRNAGAALVLLAISFALGAKWPQAPRDICGLAWAGACLQGFSVMGLYWAVYSGLPVSIAALIGGLQPALTALFAIELAGESLSFAQWTGVALGFAGLATAVWPKIGWEGRGFILPLSALAGVAFMAYASIYQKRYSAIGDAWSRTTIMFIGATVPAAAGAVLFEQGHLVWSGPMIAVYTWSVLALAVGATMALLFLIERGQASRAASLIYLVPPVSAAMAYAGFGETVTAWQVAGFGISAIGVALVQMKQDKAADAGRGQHPEMATTLAHEPQQRHHRRH
jgi:drug/metabolite transporter (DMT)-like permease